MLPEAPEEILVGEEERRQEDDQDERRDAEGDIGMETETEDQSGNQEITEGAGAQSAEEEIEGKRQEESRHYGAESDAREIDRPVRGRQHKRREDAGCSPVEEFFAEEIDAEDGQRAEENRPELESGDGIAEEGDRKSLEIDEEPFATEIGWIEKLELSGLERV